MEEAGDGIQPHGVAQAHRRDEAAALDHELGVADYPQDDPGGLDLDGTLQVLGRGPLRERGLLQFLELLPGPPRPHAGHQFRDLLAHAADESPPEPFILDRLHLGGRPARARRGLDGGSGRRRREGRRGSRGRSEGSEGGCGRHEDAAAGGVERAYDPGGRRRLDGPDTRDLRARRRRRQDSRAAPEDDGHRASGKDSHPLRIGGAASGRMERTGLGTRPKVLSWAGPLLIEAQAARRRRRRLSGRNASDDLVARDVRAHH